LSGVKQVGQQQAAHNMLLLLLLPLPHFCFASMLLPA